jgi:UDP-galactopyranose mutase
LNDLRPLSITRADASPASPDGDLICFSHLRWDFVFQRPQHLMERFARHRRVLFVEEPIPTTHHLPYLEFHAFDGTTVTAVRPRVPDRAGPEEAARLLAGLLDQMVALVAVRAPVLWFYTPMLWPAAAHLTDVAAAVVYDCMDELSAFDFAPPGLRENEAALIAAADLVLTGGHAIYEAKRLLHDNIHPFPSSVDQAHFRRAREGLATPPDQAGIPGPRLGYAGVVDERIDLALLAAAAAARPDWSFVMIGPVVKIDPGLLPRAPNIHWLGQRGYGELPAYMAGWDVALMPFALNAATRFISPTKTPEYLAAGCPVVSTPVRDVVRSYGALEAVRIADGAEAFVAACAAAIAAGKGPTPWRDAADALLAGQSWDATHAAMAARLDAAVARKAEGALPPPAAPAVRRRVAPPYDVVVAGAGFAGSVIAERMAHASGKRVLVCDIRDHVAGNAYDAPDTAGILVHRYGPHIFHTNAQEVVDYLSRFTAWRPYEHRVLADVGGDLRVPMPINRTTLAAVFGRPIPDAAAAERLLAALAEPVAKVETARDAVVATVGTRLYELFFEGYTRKQWGVDPRELDRSVTARVPARTSEDDRYFLDRFQAMPRDGYTRMFERMLDHPRIDLALGTDFHDLPADLAPPLVVFTGPIDRFFGQRFGALPYRSLAFRFETHDRRRFQETGVVNYPDAAVPWTRITEYKHLTGQVHPRTTISYEFARAEGDPFYPIPRPENQALYRRYDALGRTTPGVVFTGRLGSYRYFNMDQVVGQALATYRRLAAAPATVPAAGPVSAAHG